MSLKNCPGCGAISPWQYSSQYAAFIGCRCGLELKNSSVQTMFIEKSRIPLALERYAEWVDQPIKVFQTIGDKYPIEHPGFWWVKPTDSFRVYGHESRWNRRVA